MALHDSTAEALRTQIRDLTDQVTSLTRQVESSSTIGALDAAIDRVNLRMDGMDRNIHTALSKVEQILTPSETLAFIGVEELRTLRTRIKQLITVQEDLKSLQKSLISIITAYDQGQANVVL